MKKINRGDVFWVQLPKIDNESHIQTSKRPCCIVSNETCNRFSPVLTICPLTTSLNKKNLKTHVTIDNPCLTQPSTVLGEQVMSIDRCNILHYIGKLSSDEMARVDSAVKLQLQL